MDQFENIIRILLERDGYWVLSSVKVNLTKEEKFQTGKPSIPRPEIDLIAYKAVDQYIIALEVKSLFDSTGVQAEEISKETETACGRYKLFTCSKYRDIVFSRLKQDLLAAGRITEDSTIKLGLAAGNVKKSDEIKIENIMKQKDWFYWSPSEIKERVISLSGDRYENEAAYFVSKIICR